MSKTAIAPIIVAVLFAVQSLIGVHFADLNTLADQIAGVASAVIGLYVVVAHGILTNHKKETPVVAPVPESAPASEATAPSTTA